jgi:DNA modification methylase
MRRPLLNNLAAGQPVYDPFLGSGTTVIAAEMEGRHSLGLELDAAYCDVIVRRWQSFTGKAVTLAGEGRSFAEIDAERFDPDDNSKRCFDEAMAAIREQRDQSDKDEAA